MINEHSPSTGRTILTALAVLLVFTALVLVAMNAYMKQGSRGSVASSLLGPSADESYKQGYEAARKRFADACPLISQESHMFTATIKSANGQSLQVTQESLLSDERADGVSNDRTVTLDQNTPIIISKEKNPDTFRKELDAYNQASAQHSDSTPPGSPPSTFTESAGNLSDLKVGTRVYIETNSDARFLSSISAARIVIPSK